MNTGQEINIDLIQDLPGQGLTELFEDLEQIEQLRPHQVTWYILRLENGAAWHKQYHCDERDTNKEYQSIRHRYILRLAMQQLGYLERPGGRFIRSLQYEDRYKSIRSGCDATLLGMGASAYSHGWNYFFRNTHDPNRKKAITQYIDTVAKNELPVCEGMYLDEEIKYASRLIKGIRSSVDIDPSQRSAVNYLPEISIILQELEGQGLVVKTTSGSFCLSDMGRLLEEEVCSLLYTAAVKYRLLARGKYWHQPNKTLQKTVL
jgi:coproporphyrinogen III oxidase-like Fe-S oxidoreductase